MEKSNSATVSSYLLTRLTQLGVDTVFGVPGDFLLGFLSNIVHSSKLRFVGTCNELNASYAADGYARVKGIGVCAATYGAGELSLVNGVAGSFAENIPVLVLVGAPSTTIVQQNKLIHHRIGSFDAPRKMFEQITTFSAMIKDGASAPAIIDQAIMHLLKYRRPVYLSIHSDIFIKECKVPDDSLNLSNPLDTCGFWKSTEDTLRDVVSDLQKRISEAKHPVVILDAQIKAFRLEDRIRKFIENSGLYYASTVMGKCIVDETNEKFLGIYCGENGNIRARTIIEEISDFVLWIGPAMTDYNTGGYTTNIKSSKLALVEMSSTQIQNHHYKDIFIGHVIEQLSQKFTSKLEFPELKEHHKRLFQQETSLQLRVSKKEPEIPEETIPHSFFFDRIVKLVPKHSTFIVDTGSAMFSFMNRQFPSDCIYLSQMFYASIGYSIGASLGAALADPSRKLILVIGDGSFQQTFQDISTMLKENISAAIFVVNNNGYTIERTIHDDVYNDIPNWKYSETLHYLGGDTPSKKEIKNEGIRVSSRKELLSAAEKIWHGLNNEKETEKGIYLVESILGKMDCSPVLERSGKKTAAMNSISS